MISQIRGRLLEKDTTHAVVDVQGIGFDIQIPVSTYDKLPRVDSEVTLKTYLQVREDALVLFGFASAPERDLFMLLIDTVSGIGPKLALSCLSAMTVTSFCVAVTNRDVKTLTSISGIGKRMAERFIVELNGKMQAIAPAVVLGGLVGPEAALSRDAEDAVSALVTLGFKPEAARQGVRDLLDRLPEDQRGAKNLIRLALAAMKR